MLPINKESFILTLLAGPVATACPVCASDTADQVRAGIVSTAGEPRVLMALSLPFMLLIILAVISSYRSEKND